MKHATTFDQYAHNYGSVLDRAIAPSGEDKGYFARGRVGWLARCLRDRGCPVQSFLGYGCGTGGVVPFAFELLEVRSFTGVDISTACPAVAVDRYGSAAVRFLSFDQYEPHADVDLAFCNGVFHHIAPDERPAAAETVYRSLRPGGLFAFWENNPWQPGTRFVMSRCPFDQEAVTISPPQARRLLRERGFEILGTDFLFIFPRLLRCLRWIEPLVARFPLGTQYQVLCRKPGQPVTDGDAGPEPGETVERTQALRMGRRIAAP